MNKYIEGNSISPTINILTEDSIKAMVWLGFTEDSTTEDITSAGYILLPDFTTEPTDMEVSVASKDSSGVWSLSNIPFTEWTAGLKSRLTANVIKAQRNILLAASDWTQLQDIPASISGPWAEYRQALRDLPEQTGFPETVVWPAQPTSA